MSDPAAQGPTTPVDALKHTGLPCCVAPGNPATVRLPLSRTKPPPLGGVTVTFCAVALDRVNAFAMANVSSEWRRETAVMTEAP